jgi:hypothetical protein
MAARAEGPQTRPAPADESTAERPQEKPMTTSNPPVLAIRAVDSKLAIIVVDVRLGIREVS